MSSVSHLKKPGAYPVVLLAYNFAKMQCIRLHKTSKKAQDYV